MRGKGRRWSGHDSGKWGRWSSAAAGRPCDRLGTLGRARWRGEDAARGARGPDWREFAGTFGWADGGSVADGRRQAGSGILAAVPGQAELGFPKRCGTMQGEAACRAGEPSATRRRRVLKFCSPRPIRAVQRARLWAITCTASQAPLAAKRPDGMVQTDAVLEVSNGVLDLGVAAVSASSSRVSPSRSVMKP